MGVLKAKDPVSGLWIPVTGSGLPGPEGPAGPPGPPGVASTIIGDFGDVTTPADLPPTGLLPVDWDGPGSPTTAYQMNTGESLYYNKVGDPLEGHLFQYVSTATDPSGWVDIGSIQGPPGPPGSQGPVGDTGIQGPDGVGVPAGGTANQVLTKITATDYDTTWTDPAGGTVAQGIPPGGLTGQALLKTTDADYDANWYTSTGGGSGLPAGGNPGDTLIKNSTVDEDASWGMMPVNGGTF